MKRNRTIFFLPTIENHYSNFDPLIKSLKENHFETKLLLIEEVIISNRLFQLKEHSEDLIICSIEELDSIIKKRISNQIYLIVGNDSEPKTCEIIRIFRKKQGKVILYQDGWLRAININKPIYPAVNVLTSIKKKLHKFLAKEWMPTKKFVHNFIGQNSDYFFVYSYRAMDEFVKAGTDPERIFIVGSPRHNALRTTLPFGKEVAIVLFSTVTNNEENLLSEVKALKWIREFYPNKLLILKLHPNEDIKKYDQIKTSNFILSNSSLIDLIKEYQIEMSFCFASTVIFDMLIVNIPIIQLAPDNFLNTSVNYFTDLPLVRNQEELHYEITKFDLSKVQIKASKYLKDIDPSFNSTLETIIALKKISFV